MERPEPPRTGSEPPMLHGFLDYQRSTIVMKASGLDRDQMNQRCAASSLTLAGILKHLALVEDSWFDNRFAGRDMRQPWASAPWADDRDWEFTTSSEHEPDDLVEMYEAACARSRDTTAGVSLDTQSAHPGRDGAHWSLRWIMLHMLEETARHAGHADIIRESIDGETGE